MVVLKKFLVLKLFTISAHLEEAVHRRALGEIINQFQMSCFMADFKLMCCLSNTRMTIFVFDSI